MRLAKLLRAAVVPAAVLLTPSASPAQITLGQKDTFESGLQGWTQGINSGGSGLANPTGGPGGAADHYMQITSQGGFGADSKLIVFNQAQWTGNYIAAGVTAIEMDLMAPTTNTQPLSMRVGFQNPTLRQGYASTVAFNLPADGQWHHAVFKLTATDMTAINAPPAFNTFMSSVPEMRILSSASPALNGDTIAAVAGVDNVLATTTPVPEPTGVLAAAAAVVGVAWPLIRRRRRGTGISRET
jgi:hypothetical protein